MTTRSQTHRVSCGSGESTGMARSVRGRPDSATPLSLENTKTLPVNLGQRSTSQVICCHALGIFPPVSPVVPGLTFLDSGDTWKTVSTRVQAEEQNHYERDTGSTIRISRQARERASPSREVCGLCVGGWAWSPQFQRGTGRWAKSGKRWKTNQRCIRPAQSLTARCRPPAGHPGAWHREPHILVV